MRTKHLLLLGVEASLVLALVAVQLEKEVEAV